MKRLGMLLLFVALFVTLVACSGESVTVEYKATEGGKIVGTAIQTKELGKDGTVTCDFVMAVPSEGYRFIGWDDGTATDSRTDTVSASATYTANFEKITYSTVTYEATEGGYIYGSSTQTLETGKTATQVRAEPNEGYRFVCWSDGSTSDTRIDVVSSDMTLTATFTRASVVIIYQATEGGMIIGEATQELNAGEKTSLVFASASSGYRFVGWDDETYKENRQDTAEYDVVYTAIFKKYYNVEFVCDATVGEIIGSSYQSVFEGQRISTVYARPKSDEYIFLGWSNGSTTDTVSFIPEKNERLIAHFGRRGSGLPTISIDTRDSVPIVSKDIYTSCTVSVCDFKTGGHIIGESAMIKGRGNSTWEMEKKPYRIKFDTKQDLFGFGKAKDWVLLADHIDKSLLRNKLSYTIAGTFSELGASPACMSVEVFMNGEYIGVYLLTEQVEAASNRVEITEHIDSFDTGYLVEMDGWANREPATRIDLPDDLNGGRMYTVKCPDDEELTEAHKAYIRGYLENSMKALKSGDYEQVCSYIDVKSFAQAYLVHELMKCADIDYSSFYMYKDAGGKLICGPVWDFDMALGNSNHKGRDCQRYDYLWAKNKNPWYKALLEYDEFKALVGAELIAAEQTIRDTIAEIISDAYASQAAYEKNFERWDVMGKFVKFEPDYLLKILTWEEHVEYNVTYLENSLNFLKKTYVESMP